MKQFSLRWLAVMGALAVSAASAQETNEVDQLKRELREMREQMKRMEQKLESIELKPATPPPVVTTPPPAVVSEPETNPTELTKPWSPTDPIRVGKGSAYADIGLVGTFAVGGST